MEPCTENDRHKETIRIVKNSSPYFDNVVPGATGPVGIIYDGNGDRVEDDEKVDGNLSCHGDGVQNVVS